MPRRIRFDRLPKTPSGRNIQSGFLSPYDYVEIDDEVTVKSSLLPQCVPGNPWFESEGDNDEEAAPKSKFVVRKSTDLRRIRSVKDRVAAIISSPMVDARPRGLGRSKSFTGSTADENGAWTPLKVSCKSDLMHATSRRLSRLILGRRSSVIPQLANRKSSESLFSAAEASTPLPVSTVSVASDSEEKENALPGVPHDPSPDDLPTQPTGMGLTVSNLRLLAETETARLTVVCGEWNSVIVEESEKLPQQAVDAIRTTVCKCQLVLQHKLPFFLNLCDMAEANADSDGPRADANDLAGYWDLVADEIARADAAFDRLRKWRDDWYWDITHCPITPPRSALPVRKATALKSTKATPKRIAPVKGTRIPTRRQTPGRKVSVESLPPNVSNAIASASSSAQKRGKPAPRSKFAEFLKAKKSASSDASATRASPKVTFLTGLPTTNATPASALLTPGRSRTHKTPAGISNMSLASGDSFAIPKSGPIHRTNRSAAKDPESLSSTPRRVARIASTPLTASFNPPASPASTTRRTPSALKASAHSGRRQDTPRPPLKPKSTPLSVSSKPPAMPNFSPPHVENSSAKTERRQSLRSSKRISFAAELSHTPGGHQFGSGSPGELYPITPANKNGSIVAADRVKRRRTNLIETLSPLGLRPVTPRSARAK